MEKLSLTTRLAKKLAPGLSALGLIGLAVSAHGAVNPAMKICAMSPADSSAVIIFRNPAALDRKIVQIAGQLKIPVPQDPLASSEQSMGLTGIFDANRPAGIAVLPAPKGSLQPASQWMVAMVPVTNYAAAEKAYQCAAPQNGISAGQDPTGSPIFLAQQGGYALLSPLKDALKVFMANKAMLSGSLSPTYMKAVTRSDVSAYLNMKVLGPIASAGLSAESQMMLGFEAGDPSQLQSAAMQLIFVRAMEQFLGNSKRQFIGVHISNRGISLQEIGDMKPATPMGQLLAAQSELGKAPFAGLPRGRYVMAQAYSINGLAFSQWLKTLERPQQTTGALGPIEKNLEKDLTIYNKLVGNVRTSSSVVLSSHNGGGISAVGLGTYTDASGVMASMEGFMPKLLKTMNAANAAGPQPFVTTYKPKAISVGNVSMTRFEMKAKPGNHSVASVFKTFFGQPQMVEYFGTLSKTQAIWMMGTPVTKIPALIAASQTGVDVLGSSPSIQSAQKHVLPHANSVSYLLINRMLSDMAANLRKANGLPQPATNGLVLGRRFAPMVVSTSAQGSRMRMKAFLPMATLEDTVNQGRALAPLFMLMSEQAQ